MTRGTAWRWATLALIAILAALVASFNSGERVALNLGFTVLYQLPLVPVIFVAFLAGMFTMFLVGLRHDLRVRRALREAGFGETARRGQAPERWRGEHLRPSGEPSQAVEAPPVRDVERTPASPPDDDPAGLETGADPPPRYPP